MKIKTERTEENVQKKKINKISVHFRLVYIYSANKKHVHTKNKTNNNTNKTKNNINNGAAQMKKVKKIEIIFFFFFIIIYKMEAEFCVKTNKHIKHLN